MDTNGTNQESLEVRTIATYLSKPENRCAQEIYFVSEIDRPKKTPMLKGQSDGFSPINP
jgi:hypothetical protein